MPPGTPAPADPKRPLDGVVVLELAHYVAGPTICRVLLDLGATVVKIEPPGGEAMRRASAPGDWVPSPTYLALHREKRHIVLDMKSDEGKKAFFRLADKADVVVENFRPGVADRLGIGSTALRERNPRIVYCTLSGFGAGGPMANMATTDGVVQAFSGILEQLAARDEPFGPPATFAFADLWGGATACQAVLAALYGRERTGVGTYIEMNMLECALFARMLSTERGMVSPNTFVARGSDGVDLVLQTVPAIIPRFLELLRALPGCEDIADDPRFSTQEERIKNEDLYLSRLREAIALQPSDHWVQTFMKSGIPVSPVLTMQESLHHPQVVDRGAYSDFDVPGLGEVRLPASPFVFDGERKNTTAAPGLLNSETAAVLTDLGGYSAEELETFLGAQRADSDKVGTL
ncbi:MAG: hypothetical protein ABS81_09560 [Pseudonocardia sp. SCN 72-86]|nr:MAG: hypothetical protein ABS81_09560 [Pseudonocardia sp. SCN 72-86]